MAIEFRTGEEITKKITGKDLEKLTMMLNDALVILFFFLTLYQDFP